MLGWLLMWVWVGLMVLVFALAWFWHLRPRRIETGAWRALAVGLRRVSTEAGGGSRAVQANPRIQSQWKRFQEAWNETTVSIRGTLVSPVRLIDVVDDHPMPRTVAGVLLSLGILGTFIGITLGLYGIETGNPDLLLESVESLLSGMFLAFASSILGLLLFLLWRSGVWRTEAGLTKALTVADEAAQAHFPWIPADELGVLLLAESRDYAQRHQQSVEGQSAILANLAEDIAEKLEDPLTAALNDSLAPPLEALTGRLEEFAAAVQEAQSEGVETMVREFQEALAGNVRQYIDNLNESLERSIDHVERFESAASKTLRELQTLGEAQSDLLQRTDAVSETFTSSLEGLERVHGALHDTLEEHTEAATQMREFSDNVRGEAEVLSNANREVREALASHLDTVDSQVSALSEHAQAMRTQMDEIVPRLERSVTEFSGMAADRIRQVFEEFDKQMADVTRHLSGTLQQVRDNVDDLAPATDRLGLAIEELNRWSDNSMQAQEGPIQLPGPEG